MAWQGPRRPSWPWRAARGGMKLGTIGRESPICRPRCGSLTLEGRGRCCLQSPLRTPPGVSHPARGVPLRGATWAGVVGAAASRWALSARRARRPGGRGGSRGAKAGSGLGVQQGGPAATGSEQGHPAAMRTWPGHGIVAGARLVTPSVARDRRQWWHWYTSAPVAPLSPIMRADRQLPDPSKLDL